MRPDFSEFSYGFALTNEICRRALGKIKLAPVFPSLIEEGRTRGYDVALSPGYPLFLQFKISEYLVRRDAREWESHRQPYYRFWLHPSRHSQQHDHLLALDHDPNVVLYAAPMFHKAERLDHDFRNSTVTSNSIFFRPRHIGMMPDRDEHSISFVPGRSPAWRYSEPKAVLPHAFGDAFFQTLETLVSSNLLQEPSADLFGSLASHLLEPLGVEEGGWPFRFLSQRARAASIARTLYGAELLWLYPS